MTKCHLKAGAESNSEYYKYVSFYGDCTTHYLYDQ